MADQVRHVCLFRLRHELTAAERSELQRYAAEILASCAGVLAYRFDDNRSRKSAGFGLVLDSTFASPADLAAYVRAPLHDALAAFMDGFVEQTIVADYDSRDS